jgi:hypothetical protein
MGLCKNNAVAWERRKLAPSLAERVAALEHQQKDVGGGSEENVAC